jgi:hypothetical protein
MLLQYFFEAFETRKHHHVEQHLAKQLEQRQIQLPNSSRADHSVRRSDASVPLH